MAELAENYEAQLNDIKEQRNRLQNANITLSDNNRLLNKQLEEREAELIELEKK